MQKMLIPSARRVYVGTLNFEVIVASIYDIKPAFQNLLRPVVRGLAATGVTANQVTVAAVILSGLSGAAIAWRPEATWPLVCMPVVLLLRMALNAIDGMLAREHDMKTHLGAVLNELGDVTSDAMMYMPLALVPGVNGILIVVIVILATLTEMAGVLAQVLTGERRYDGPMGKSDRAFFFGVFAIALALGLSNAVVVIVALGIVTLLLVVTVLNRARGAARGPS
jgi:CDP-diacylglycerol--glycerol-3-phosphate 3-phosphatidyltransferase